MGYLSIVAFFFCHFAFQLQIKLTICYIYHRGRQRHFRGLLPFCLLPAMAALLLPLFLLPAGAGRYTWAVSTQG